MKKYLLVAALAFTAPVFAYDTDYGDIVDSVDRDAEEREREYEELKREQEEQRDEVRDMYEDRSW